MDRTAQILQFFRQNNGYACTKDILGAGFHHTYLSRLVNKGQLELIKRGLYKLPVVDNQSELEEVMQIVPQGVVCMHSAWAFYELSDFVPPNYHIAIKKTQKRELPIYPPVKLYYWNEKVWNVGITKVEIGNSSILIYEKEKVVCDAIKFRNKVGKETEKEVLKNYIKSKNRNIDQLFYFARLLHVEQLLKNYLNMML